MVFLRSMKQPILYLILLVFILHSCKDVENKTNPVAEDQTGYAPIEVNYAHGFQIKTTATGYQVTIKNPWPDSAVNYPFTLVKHQGREFVSKANLPVRIPIPIEKIVVTSTTHITPLVLLGEEKSLIGFPATDYISAPKVRSLIDAGNIKELGTNQLMNVEAAIILEPDLVMGFSIDDSNPTYQKIEEAGIPVLYNGDWVEEHPLGKAEWIKLFGVLYGKEKEADSIFKTIEKEYQNTLKLAAHLERPKVLSGATYKDQWYLPYGNSWQGKILKDAGADYLYAATKGTGSLAYNIEKVLIDGREATYWIAPAQYTSYSKMLADNKSYALFDSFKNRQVYTHALTVGAKGGVLYYEEASMRPDLVLKDLVKILHPDLALDHELYFFRALKE
jgi:iron complex transport system substrate-binding protein